MQHKNSFSTSCVLTALTSTRYDRDTGERVASLETDVHGSVGNGNPGRVAMVELAVAKLTQ
jgi:hypothetical protein